MQSNNRETKPIMTTNTANIGPQQVLPNQQIPNISIPTAHMHMTPQQLQHQYLLLSQNLFPALAPKKSITISPMEQQEGQNPYLRGAMYPTSSRKWQIRLIDEIAKTKYKDLECVITMKIRGEEATSYVPEKLYSSHKYVIEHIISGSITQDFPLLVSRVQVIDPKSNEEILKNKKPIIKGAPEAALTLKSEGLEGKNKIQFTDVSYHHAKAYFALRMNYYDPKNLDHPLFELVSPPFRVYARKPSIPQETLKPHKPKPLPKPRKSRKRKLESTAQSTKKSKKVPSNLYEEFEKKLDELVQMKNQLSDEDRRTANESSLERLLALDPGMLIEMIFAEPKNDSEYTIDFFLRPNANGTPTTQSSIQSSIQPQPSIQQPSIQQPSIQPQPPQPPQQQQINLNAQTLPTNSQDSQEFLQLLDLNKNGG